jgi:hypothetical protein
VTERTLDELDAYFAYVPGTRLKITEDLIQA